MTPEEKELLEKVLAESNNVSERDTKADEPDDEVVIQEVNQAIELLTFSVELLKRKETPPGLKKGITNIYPTVREGILDRIICMIDPRRCKEKEVGPPRR